MWLEARDDGTDDSDGEHPDIHQVGEPTRSPDDADDKDHSDEDECCRERNADGGSVRGSVRLRRFLRGGEIGPAPWMERLTLKNTLRYKANQRKPASIGLRNQLSRGERQPRRRAGSPRR